MKITAFNILDPRARGLYHDPIAKVTVNEEVDEQGAAIFDHTKSQSHRLVPCGPFWAPEYRPDSSLIFWYDMDDVIAKPHDAIYKRGIYSKEEIPDYGFLNKIGLVEHQLFPVEVVTPSDDLPLAMEVPRIRRLIRTHDLGFDWVLIVDEESAMRGLLKWRLEHAVRVCYGGAMPASDHCLSEPINTIIYRNTHLSLCRRHLDQHNERIRRARLQYSN